MVRQHKLGEADRIVTLLTRQHGLVRAVAKGVRRTKSRFGARLEPFSYIDVQLHPGRTLDTVTQVHTMEAFAADIIDDYGRYTTACAVLETAERLAGEERAPAPRLHALTASALRAIAAKQRPHELILDAFLLRAMGFAGWAPALDECAKCATPGPHRAFHVAAGGAVCVHCRPPGAATPAPGVLDLLVALLRGEWERVETTPEAVRRQASGLVAAHLQWHLERQLRTLPLIERSKDAAGRIPPGDASGGVRAVRPQERTRPDEVGGRSAPGRQPEGRALPDEVHAEAAQGRKPQEETRPDEVRAQSAQYRAEAGQPQEWAWDEIRARSAPGALRAGPPTPRIEVLPGAARS